MIRVYGGDLKYSDAERKATMKERRSGSSDWQTGTASSTSSECRSWCCCRPGEITRGKRRKAQRVDRMTARGHVVVTSEGRRGTGEQLVYTSQSGEYVLTGTSSSPPQNDRPGARKC